MTVLTGYQVCILLSRSYSREQATMPVLEKSAQSMDKEIQQASSPDEVKRNPGLP